MSKTELLFQNLQNSLKLGTDLNADATFANTRVTHITILEVYTLMVMLYSISTNKKSKHNKTVMF